MKGITLLVIVCAAVAWAEVSTTDATTVKVEAETLTTTTAEAETPTASPTSVEIVDGVEECPQDQEDWTIDVLIKHEDCDKFYKCNNGEPIEMSCPSQLLFNLETRRCDWPKNVDCEGRNVPNVTVSTTTPSTTTTMQVPTEFLPNGCPVDPLIHWLLPHPTDCTSFFYCVWGGLVLRNCPDGLHFNRTVQVCDWPWSAGCTISINKHHMASRTLLN